ncbi:unnamed protein product [Adineta steineri]|uniref:Uncharacterized protein n=1 Tax=Adineta steineri TaxID=433720 RepID=A0A818LEJ4_9BILA|nr:unnamed protein product [Adineta steineri]CAF3576158.1 unnamed protein product [Adineta steineri]
MLSNIQYWEQFIVYFFIFLKPVSNQGLACYKCMTTNAEDDGCRDPFSSLINPVQVNCQATSVGKNGTFPARFCVKISGRILGIDDGGNNSFLNTIIYYRTCVVDNIMESTKSLESSGNFRLKNFPDMSGSIRLQGVMSLCAFDGCNSAQTHISSLSIILTDNHPENDNQLSHRKNNNYDHSEDERDYYIPKTSADRKDIIENQQSTLLDISRKFNENSNRFLSTKTTDHETEDQRPFSSYINRNHKESSVRRTSASSSEDFSGDKYSSSKARNQNTHTASEVPYDTTRKIDSNDTHKNDFDSTFDTKSWFTDENSDQK